jgi:hypothetical protein
MNRMNQMRYAPDDLFVLVQIIDKYVRRRKAILDIPAPKMVTQILKYIQMRERLMWWEIDGPYSTVTYPAGWTPDHEELWADWFEREFSLDSWEDEVMDPMFGTRVQPWEIDGWRQEIYTFLPTWIQRSISLLAPIDPNQNDVQEEETESVIDPYLLEHGSAKQRKNAVRGQS